MFNCCTNGVLPDLSSYEGLEINAVYPKHDKETDVTFCEALFGVASGEVALADVLEAEIDVNELFYTVYARDSNGEAEAIHDEPSFDDIKKIAAGIVDQYPHLTTTIN